jgi:hypothetical protein
VNVRIALGILLTLALAAPAQAAPRLDVDLVNHSVRYGAAHRLNGTLLDGTTPLAGQEIVLEGRRYPYEGSYRVIERTTTDAEGTFAIRPELDRNHRLRVVAPALNLRSDTLRAYTLPAFELSFRAIRPGVVRLYQRYRVPRSVRLTAPTLFYLGPRRAERATRRVSADTERTRAGRYTAVTTFRVPAAWNGAFRYASCFRASPRSGMGDPKQSCPRLRLKF